MSVIDDYLKDVAPTHKVELERIRSIVHQLVPDAEEVISYGVPAFKYQKQYLIGFAAYKNHLGVFPTPGPIAALADKLTAYETSKGGIQCTPENPLPKALLEQIIKSRLADISKTT